MADKSMKAVIRAEVDPSGVIKGVAATNRELAKLNSKTSAIAVGASFNMAQMGFQMLMGAFRIMDRRMTEMAQMATRFSPEAQRGVMETQIAKINQEIEMAKAYGLDVAGVERAKRQGITERTRGDVSAAGGGQLAFTESLKQSAESMFNESMNQLTMTFTDPGKKFSMENLSNLNNQFGFGTSGQEKTAGMSDAPRRDEEVLRQIHRTLKGGS
jgi:hypothetical protein